MRRWSAARSRARRPSLRWPCGARRPSWRPSPVSASRRSGAGGSSCSSTSTATGSWSTRCSPAGSSSPPRARSCRPRPRSSWRSGRAPVVRPTRRRGPEAPAGCRTTTRRPRSAIATRPRWARSTSCPPGSTAVVPGLDDELGPDADDPALTLEVWRARIRRHPGELKNVLKNQSFVAGIGNAYSDEILHAAGLLPFRKRSTLAAEEVDSLYEATRTTLARADRHPAGTRPADLRDPGPRLPRRPRQGRDRLPPLRDADQRGEAGRVRDLVLPGCQR